ncbi:hypothetical protein SAMN05216420_10918 [Nitrosospira sp. Nl5]|nr:hypothetical protein SAMN05216420_10918 [Nitrosospira sp. Nl5]
MVARRRAKFRSIRSDQASVRQRTEQIGDRRIISVQQFRRITTRYIMKHIPVLKSTQSVLLAGIVVFGIAGVVHAQIRGGPGQVGGMGQGGAPAGEFPSDRGNALPTQRNMQGGASPGQDMPGKKDPSRDSSQEQRPGSTKRDLGAGSSTSKEPGASNSSSTPQDSSTPRTPPSGTGGY